MAPFQRMKWGIDVDGVLSVFDEAFVEVVRGIDVAAAQGLQRVMPPKRWDWMDDAEGFTPAINKEAWRRIIDSECFWHDCRSYPDAEQFLGIANDLVKDPGIHVYFITSRPGQFAKLQTEWWLEERGMNNPTVLICNGDKTPIIKGLELDLMIDDRPDTIRRLQQAFEGTPTRIYAQDRPWNQDVRADNRVSGVMEMLMKEGVFS